MSQPTLESAFSRIETLEKETNKLRGELDRLKFAHDAVANNIEPSILRTQRVMARFMAFSMGHYYIDAVQREKPRAVAKFASQVLVDISSIREQIISSNEPMKLFAEQQKKWNGEVKKIGVNLVDIN